MNEQAPDSAPQEPDLDRIAREVGIPPCPAILGRFSAEMQQPEPDMRKLAELIAADIALSAALLKLVNSPFYGLRTKATNVHQALSIIGLRAGANLVYSFTDNWFVGVNAGFTHLAGDAANSPISISGRRP